METFSTLADAKQRCVSNRAGKNRTVVAILRNDQMSSFGIFKYAIASTIEEVAALYDAGFRLIVTTY